MISTLATAFQTQFQRHISKELIVADKFIGITECKSTLKNGRTELLGKHRRIKSNPRVNINRNTVKSKTYSTDSKPKNSLDQLYQKGKVSEITCEKYKASGKVGKSALTGNVPYFEIIENGRDFSQIGSKTYHALRDVIGKRESTWYPMKQEFNSNKSSQSDQWSLDDLGSSATHPTHKIHKQTEVVEQNERSVQPNANNTDDSTAKDFDESVTEELATVRCENVEHDHVSEINVIDIILDLDEIKPIKSKTNPREDQAHFSNEDILSTEEDAIFIDELDLIDDVFDDFDEQEDNELNALNNENKAIIKEGALDQDKCQRNADNISGKPLANAGYSESMDHLTKDIEPKCQDDSSEHFVQKDLAKFETEIGKAVNESFEANSITPILKQELQYKVQCDRLARGEDELFLEPEPPRNYELREDEIQKKNKRKEQNRRSAKRSRKVARENELKLAMVIDRKTAENTKLMREKKLLMQERADLVSQLTEHLQYCPNTE